ncbi:ArsR/SmtB family transcription factor [Clostridium sp.]
MILNIMKCLYDKTRLRILSILYYKNGPMCVGSVEESLQLSQPNASRHLKRLLNDGFVIMSKKTQFVYYELNPQLLKEYDFLNCLLKKNIEEMEECKDDIRRMENKIKCSL